MDPVGLLEASVELMLLPHAPTLTAARVARITSKLSVIVRCLCSAFPPC